MFRCRAWTWPPQPGRPLWCGALAPTVRHCRPPRRRSRRSGPAWSKPPAAAEALDGWISWARRCRIPAFVALQKRILKHKDKILAAIEHNLSNGLVGSTNTKIRLITRMAYGFSSPQALIALAMLNLGGHRPDLPGRQ